MSTTTSPRPLAWWASRPCSPSNEPRRRALSACWSSARHRRRGTRGYLQLAKPMGAGRVVGAGRSAEGLERVPLLRELGADEVVQLGDGDLTEAFEQAAGGPLDIVIICCGVSPAMAALRAIATEGRLVNVGQAAGTDVRLPLENVRNHQGAIHAISSGWTDLEPKAAAYRRLSEHVAAGRLSVDRDVVPLDEVSAAWERQDTSPGRKLVIAAGQRA